MKNLMLIVSLLVSFTQHASAFDVVQDKGVYAARLVEFNVGQPWLGQINQGSIVLDLENATLDLTLSSYHPCPPNAVCTLGMEEYHNIQLNITTIAHSDCGTKYVGEVDKTPMDGLKEVVTVVDYSEATCEMVIKHPTTVEYETFNPWTQETLISHFGGVALLLQPTFFN